MSVLGAIGRLIWVPLSFVVAMIGAVFLLGVLGLERLTAYLSAETASGDPGPALIGIVLQAGFLLTGATIIPALLVVLIGEVGRIRSFVFYVLGGGFALAAIPLMAQAGVGLPLPPASLWQVFATAGFFGGFIYWLLAGRSA